MALETLKEVNRLGAFRVIHMDELREEYPEKFNESGSMDYKWFEKEIRPKNFIYIRHDVNSLSFTLQNGPILENGVNGCQVNQVIEAAKKIMEGLNYQKPCKENEAAISSLQNALNWLDKRTKRRANEGVEGTRGGN